MALRDEALIRQQLATYERLLAHDTVREHEIDHYARVEELRWVLGEDAE
jgi:hypothetical protein